MLKIIQDGEIICNDRLVYLSTMFFVYDTFHSLPVYKLIDETVLEHYKRATFAHINGSIVTVAISFATLG